MIKIAGNKKNIPSIFISSEKIVKRILFGAWDLFQISK